MERRKLIEARIARKKLQLAELQGGRAILDAAILGIELGISDDEKMLSQSGTKKVRARKVG